MAAGGEEQILKKIKSGLSKPCHLPDVKDHISSLQSISEKEKEEYGRKVSNMIEKKQQIEQEMQNLKKLLFENACKDLPTELHRFLKESKVLVKDEDDYIDVTSQIKNFGPVIPFSEDRAVVAAIEIGNTFSGCAYSFANSPEKIYLNKWHGAMGETDKTLTTLLLDSEGKFVAFGYEAEDRYADYYFFKSFRNCLEKSLKPTTYTSVKDVSGKSLKAQTIFALSIKYLIEQISKNLSGIITMDDVNIILTVPAIWNDAQIQILREAAMTVGIRQDYLSIVPEPIAASCYWRWYQKNTEDTRVKQQVSQVSEENQKYLVLDLGGDTSNLTVFSGTGTGLDKAVSTAVCPWGGNSVNHEFTIFLHDLFELEVMEKMKRDFPEEYIDIMTEFERKKYATSTQNIVLIRLPISLNKLVTKQTLQKDHVSNKYIQSNAWKLRLPGDVFRDFFKPAINGILEYLSTVLDKKENMDVDTIVMVGGFSNCKQIQNAITNTFPHKTVIIPNEPGLSILKGAIFCGHIPVTFFKKISRYTYGVQSYPEFDPNIHPQNKKVIIGETAYCKDVFCKYIERGNDVPVGTKNTHLFRVLSPEIKYLKSELYISTDQNPMFIDDVTCKHMGTISIALPQIEQMGPVRIVEESVIFCDTEIRLEARNMKLQTHEVTFTFTC